MADPKITDSRDDHKTFQSIRRNEINIDYYNLCEEDESNFVYQRNLFKALPFLKPESCKSCPNSRFDFRKEKLIDPESFFLAKSLSNYPESVKKEDRARFERLKSFYLLHEIPDFKMQNMNEFESDLKTSIERCHPSVARIIGYTFKHPKNKDKSFLLLTERPVNGSLYSYFNFLSRYNQSNAKFSKSCSKSTISEPYSNENIKLSNEQKYLMILGIISGIEFIHKLGFVHSKLNPSSIFLDEQLRSVICNYEFKHESKETEENDIISILNKSPAFVSPETYQSQIVTQKSDVFCFGMIVYYILTETLPYGKLKKDKIAKALIDRELPVLPNDFDECWSSLIERCCDSNPDDRPDSNELLLELLDKDAMYKYVKSMSPGYKPKFTDAQIDYVNRLLDIYTLNQNNEDLIDFDIYDLIDKSEIHHEDVETFTKCNQSNVECLKKVAYYFLRGENNYPKDDELALAVFQRAADLNDPESTKMIAKLYQENWSNIGDLNTSLAYYNIALKLYKDNEAECKEINHEIKQIKKKIDNPSKYFGKFGKDEDAKRPKEVTFEDTTIFFQEVSNRATKDSIINFFKSYNNVKVKMKPNAFSQSAKVTFESLKDKTKVLNEIRRHPNNFMLYNERMVLLPTNRALQRQRARRRIQGTLLGAPIIAKRQIFRHTKNLQLNLNDFYPGPGKIKKKKDDDDDDDDNDVINTEYERIGSGSFGIAYKIYEKKTNKIYVAKVFKYSFKDIKEKKNFRREIAAQTEIRHPLVIRIYGYAMHSLTSPNLKVPTLIMEYAPNKTLADVIREDPDWWDKTTKIMAIIGISRGMSFIHNQNYIHRDLKPDNIFFDENHEVKIGDFGCSRKCSSNDAMSNAIGTPLYMAPELFDECHVYYSYEVDVYPFGFILLEILTGKLTESPTRDKYRFYSKFVLKNWRPEIPEELDENLKKIIRLSWSKFVNDRPLYQEIFTIFRSLFDGPLNKDSYIKGILDGVDIARVKDYLKRLDSYEY